MMLDNSIEFDTAFIVLPNGEYVETSEYVPTVYNDGTHDVIIESSVWEALTGYSGQYSYSGAVMHPSEYFGGGLLKDVSEDIGGVYALTGVYDLDDEGDLDIIGWTVLRKLK